MTASDGVEVNETTIAEVTAVAMTGIALAVRVSPMGETVRAADAPHQSSIQTWSPARISSNSALISRLFISMQPALIGVPSLSSWFVPWI